LESEKEGIGENSNYGRQVILHAENFGDRYFIRKGKRWGRHPLLEAAIEYMQVPESLSCEITIFSEAPSGASTGTSAAVTVALVGALEQLTPGSLTPYQVAFTAQKIEAEILHQQCGIQDQLCSAYGGINYIEMDEYPHATVSPVQISEDIWWELERRLVLVFLGKSHQSSETHEMVIKSLENAGPDCKQLNDLRITAEKSRDALCKGDFTALGTIMIENTQAQARLHPQLVHADAERIFEISHRYGALGWKVNGAGGKGGSITILCNENSNNKRSMIREIEQENPLYKNVPIQLSQYGLRVWKQTLA
jgi:D-glycero-alpha-D-manno-heptose-7-phosphate kinase